MDHSWPPVSFSPHRSLKLFSCPKNCAEKWNGPFQPRQFNYRYVYYRHECADTGLLTLKIACAWIPSTDIGLVRGCGVPPLFFLQPIRGVPVEIATRLSPTPVFARMCGPMEKCVARRVSRHGKVWRHRADSFLFFSAAGGGPPAFFYSSLKIPIYFENPNLPFLLQRRDRH